MSPMSSLSVVLLPAPLGPSSPKTSPAGTSRDRASNARYGRPRQNPTEKSLVSPSVRTTLGIDSAGSLRNARARLPQFKLDRVVEVLCREPGAFVCLGLHAVDEVGRRVLDIERRAVRRVTLDVRQQPVIFAAEVRDAQHAL